MVHLREHEVNMEPPSGSRNEICEK